MEDLRTQSPFKEWKQVGIYCPRCLKGLYRFIRDVRPEDDMVAMDVEPMNDDVPPPKDGDETHCPFCNYDWYYDPEHRRIGTPRN